jgi:tetratricopeptide (TPR) repeat protein
VLKAALFALPWILLCVCSGAASAQSRDRFVEALVELSTAVDGTYGDEGPRVVAAIDAMSASLAGWNQAVASAESRFAEEVRNAPPAARARMHASLGLVYLDSGRYADGIRELEASARIEQNADVEVLRALTLARLGRSADAAGPAEAAWRVKRTDPVLAVLVLQTARDVEGEAAREALELLRAQRPRLLEARAPGAPPFALISLLDDAAAPRPVLAPAAYAPGYASIVKGEYAAAVEQFRAAAAADPLVAAPAQASDAIAALRRDDADTAVRLMLEAVARAPASSETHRVLAAALQANGQAVRAVEHFERAVRLAPRDDRARLGLAGALEAAGDPARAEQALAEAVALDPRSGEAHLRLALLYQPQQLEADALKAFESAAASSPLAGAARLHVTIGRVQENQLDPDGAVAAFRRAVEIDPNDATARRELGEVLLSAGDLNGALAALLSALLIDPLDGGAWTGIAHLDAADGRHEDALAAVDRAIVLNPRLAEAHYARAQALLRLDRAAEAAAALERFRTLQAEAMEEQRRTYERTLRAIEAELEKPSGAAR